MAVDRAIKIRDYIEQLISLVGEHPECELKGSWPRNTAFNKAEIVKDIQATANSAIARDKEKYIVIGADEQTRRITGCNPTDYDDASLRQLVEQYLDPVPDFEVLSLKSSDNRDFVVLRFPFQAERPIFAKAQIRGDNNQVFLDVGQIWIKPGGSDTGSTGKRLVKSRQELLGLIDIEPRVNHEVESRIQQLLPDIRLEERTRLSAGENVILPVFTATHEEFESYIEQMLVGERINHLHVALEKIRDRVVSSWESAFDENQKITAEQIAAVKEHEFSPAMSRLVLLGMLLIKFSAPPSWLSAVIDLLIEVFHSSHVLRKAQYPPPDERDAAESLEQHKSFTVPALEALLATYVVTAYALVTRQKYEYLRVVFPRVVSSVEGGYGERSASFLLFWPLTYQWGTPDIRRDLLVADRYGRGDRIESLMGNVARIKTAVLQVDCLIDWHSVLAQRSQGTQETYDYFLKKYPDVNTWYVQNFTKESLMNISPLVRKIWDAIIARDDQLFLDEGLASSFNASELERRKQVFAKFVAYAEREQANVMWAQQRYPFLVHWEPSELRDLVNSMKGS